MAIRARATRSVRTHRKNRGQTERFRVLRVSAFIESSKNAETFRLSPVFAPLIGDHSPQLLLIGLIGHHTLTQLALALFGFGRQDMARKRMSANHLARAGLLEALGRALVSL